MTFLTRFWPILIGLPVVYPQANLQPIGGQGFNTNPLDYQDPNQNVFNIQDQFEPRVVDGAGQEGLDSQYTRITGYNIREINWNIRDRRYEEAWWHLYPFGERYFDSDMGFLGRSFHDQQLDLDFFFPYYGFRFNYTFVFPEGFIAFSYPWYIQPPYTFPTSSWPNEPDPSLVAAFMAPTQFMFVGDYKISHVWYRIITRPNRLISERQYQSLVEAQPQFEGRRDVVHRLANGKPAFRNYGPVILKIQDGRVEDPELLDRITHDIQTGMVGARGFTADYAFVVTWERMGYGGAPKQTRLDLYDEFKRWQNTYQMVLATDEIRSYAIFNYGNVNWTASTSAGAIFGRGGKQSAVVGFNGGNGTGFFQMPWSAEGNSYKLAQDGSTQTAGRWMARIDEVIEYGGCINTSTGILQMDRQYGTMLGGFALNVSGPCFRPGNVLKLQLFDTNLDCQKVDMVIARCVIPVNTIYQQGMVNIKLSIDGGKEYNFWNKFYLLSPNQGRRKVSLLDDPTRAENSQRVSNWRLPNPDNLTMRWQAANLTYERNAQVDITLWGYWEDIERHEFREIAYLEKNVPNRGVYTFNPRQLVTNRQNMIVPGAWDKFQFGVIQVKESENTRTTFGDGIQWSDIVPFGWYFKRDWEREYGADWAIDKCIDWFGYDGKLYNFWQDLEPQQSCPCTMDQAMMDVGRFMPLWNCDVNGDSSCPYNRGSQHCVISTYAIWTGSAQTCCYDQRGYLLFGQDYEYNNEWLNSYSAGVPQRAHPLGSYPFRRPPYIPGMSNFYNDVMPYEVCCRWADHCEFFYWRRETSGCQEYLPPTAGFAYGEPHFITYDGVKYTFNGKGYFVLSMRKSRSTDFMAQVRMEQPPKTDWNAEVRATVITGVAARDNNSDIVQVFSRKDFRRWRYKTDVYVGGIRVFFDMAWKKTQYFNGVMLRSPARNMNMSEIQIMFRSGVGLRVMESNGILDVMVTLPPAYNQTYAWNDRYGYNQQYEDPNNVPISGNCQQFDRTMGLLGTFNGRSEDDLMSPDCNPIQTSYPPSMTDSERVFRDFGNKWRVEGTKHELLFQETHKPIFNPMSFGEHYARWVPIFDPSRIPLGNASFMFSGGSRLSGREQIRLTCNGEPSCMYDYYLTGRKEIALETLSIELKNEGLKRTAERRLTSCGPLQKNKGVIKFFQGDSYMDGAVVTFTCKDEYFLHGEQTRTCMNGTWSPGWWAWCRSRTLETGLKWATGILVSLLFLFILCAIFGWCYYTGVRGRKSKAKHYRTNPQHLHMVPPAPNQMKAPPYAEKARYDIPPPNNSNQNVFTLPVMEEEPVKPGGNGMYRKGSPKFSETSA